MNQLAPIILFCYNRPRLTERTLVALSQNLLADQSELYVFCDGPRQDADSEQCEKIEKVRTVVRREKWCGKVTIIESEHNKGLANSVIEGVTQIIAQFGRVIVLEDDLLVSRFFLEYMNKALDKYASFENVMQISAHQFLEEVSHVPSSGFIPMTTSWGWGTWYRAWKKFDPICKDYERLKTDPRLRRDFDLQDSYPYSDMLLAQMSDSGQIDSWAIRWWWTVFQQRGVSLFPCISLVQNIGFGIEATHTVASDQINPTFNFDTRIVSFPENSDIDQQLWARVRDSIKSKTQPSTRKQKQSWWFRLLNINSK